MGGWGGGGEGLVQVHMIRRQRLGEGWGVGGGEGGHEGGGRGTLERGILEGGNREGETGRKAIERGDGNGGNEEGEGVMGRG